MATSRKIGFFLRKKPRSPVGERARNVLRTMLSVSPEIARKAARHPAESRGGAVTRVCAYACAVAVARVCAQGARRCLCRGACMRVGVFARRARGGARSRRRSRRFCRKSVDPSGVPALPARGRAHKYAGHTPGALQNTFLQMKRKTTRFPGAWHRGAVGAP